MNCEQVKDMLVNYLDNGVSDTEKALIEEHLANCPDCREEIEALAAVQDDFRKVMRESIAGLSVPMHALSTIKQRMAKRHRRKLPILHSIKSQIAEWWRSIRLRPAWQQACILVPIAAVLVGSGAAAIGYTINRLTYRDTVRFGTCFNIYMIDADGSNLVQLTDDGFWDGLASFSPDGSKILVSSAGAAPGDDHELYIMDIDGSNVVQLTDNDSDDLMAKFSPDGSKIGFVSYRDTPLVYIDNPDDPDGPAILDEENSGKGDIYVMNLDGTNVIRITKTADVCENLFVWSPDGSKFAVHSSIAGTGGYNDEINVINTDGTGLVDIVQEQDGIYTLQSSLVSWSPDSTQLLFSARHIDNGLGMYVANADGSGVTNITPAGIMGYPQYPKYSPDGTKIAFLGPYIDWQNDTTNFALFTMNIDGSNITKLGDVTSRESTYWWAPDSSTIVYTAEPDFDESLDGHEIFVVNADGTGNTRLTQNDVPDLYPKWSKDSTKILFFRVEERLTDPDE